MPDYNLAGLSSRSFEHLVQAIALRALGPGVSVFGDGPDGGREATFEGRADFPSKAKPWDGYTVIQAKFLQRPLGAPHDGQWAVEELKKELDRFVNSSKRRRAPKFYIFATNAVATPTAVSGSKDKAAQLIERYRSTVPIQDWRIWDFDQICRYLDLYAEIRKAYMAFVTPGDVLAVVVETLQGLKPDFHEIAANFLAKELASDQFVNLEQAGHSVEDKIPLARVFVDLPVSSNGAARFVDADFGTEDGSSGLVRLVLDEARDRLDPASVRQRQSPYREGVPVAPDSPSPGRFVVIGGPGQGKTTVGQFVCQLFRAALLLERPPHLLAPEVVSAISAIRTQCTAQEIGLPAARRFPVRIVLNEFAAFIQSSGQSPDSLLAYITKRIYRRTGREPSIDELKTWMAQYPWLLVLDGLDEVAASTNRDRLLKKIEEFWIDAAQCNADVLVVATTRPQGYSEEFSPSRYRHLWLVPLSRARAMQYAARLVEARYGSDEDRRERILSRLRQASGHEATARLMRSPLQVTIMATLVDRIGQPPQDRWRLFKEYYEVIYRREMERDIPAAELLRELRTDIDAIHRRTAVLLQIESELAGGQEARLPAERLRAIVQSRLQEEGHSGAELDRLSSQILEAAGNRLVFLTGLQSGQVGFEIRSLQEFMAAEALMDGRESNVQDRLRQIAPIANWRNVFLFAAGRCFAEEQQLRDTVAAICVDLNVDLGGPVARAVRAGSTLALDLLEDGVAHKQPRFAKILAEIALKILDLAPSEIHARLAEAYEPTLSTLFEDEVCRRLVSGDLAPRLGAWAVLLPLASKGVLWATKVAKANWPARPQDQVEVLSGVRVAKPATWLRERIVDASPRVEPSTIWTVWSGIQRAPENEIYYWLNAPIALEGDGAILARLPEPLGETASLAVQGLNRMQPDFKPLEDCGNLHPIWSGLLDCLKFAQDPTKLSLARALQTLADTGIDPQRYYYYARKFPWVLASAVEACANSRSVADMAERARQGQLGDRDQWFAAEERWRTKGISREDLAYPRDVSLPIDFKIHEIGFPVAIGELVVDEVGAIRVIESMYQLYRSETAGPYLRKNVARWLLDPFLLPEVKKVPEWLTPELYQEWAEISEAAYLFADFLELLAKGKLLDQRWLRLLDAEGRSTRQFYFISPYPPNALARALAQAILTDGSRLGLVTCLAASLREGATLEPVDFRLDPESMTDPSVRQAAMTVLLIGGRLDSGGARKLARLAVESSSCGESSAKHVLSAIVDRDTASQITDEFMLECLTRIPANDLQSRSLAIRGLNHSLRKRRSLINERPVYNRLSLPTALFEVLTSRN